MNSLPKVRSDVYRLKSIITRSRNARGYARLAVLFAERQAKLEAKLDAIVNKNKIDYAAELEMLQDAMEDEDYHRLGGW